MGLVQPATIIILTCFAFFPCLAQSGMVSTGARHQAMGNASVALEDPFAAFSNVAATAYISSPIIISSFENKYGFSPFQLMGAGVIYPLKRGVVSFTLQKFGSSAYNEQHCGIGFSHTSGSISLGVKLNYTQFSIEDTDRKGKLVLEIGGLAKLLPNLTFGAHIYNLSQTSIAKEADLLVPFILKSGFSYKPIEVLVLCVEAEKNLDQKVRVKGGVEYQFLKKFNLRSGVSSAPFQQYYGLGFSPSAFVLDYSLENHSTLGLSHQISLTYKFRKK